MSTHAEASSPRARLLSWGIAYTPAAVLAVLLPKCPLCIAAPLTLIGVAIPLPSYARTLGIVASLVLGTLFILARRTRRGGPVCGACSSRRRTNEPSSHAASQVSPARRPTINARSNTNAVHNSPNEVPLGSCRARSKHTPA
jgi:hypothetical protein